MTAAERYALMLECMDEGIYTVYEIAEMTGLHFRTVAVYTRAIRKKNLAHICGWETDKFGRNFTMILKLGPGKDVKRAVADPSVSNRRYKAKARHIKLLHRMASPWTSLT